MVTIAWNDAVTKLAYALCKSVWNDGRVLALAITKTMQLCQREWREAVKTSLAKGNRPRRIHIAFDIHTYVNPTDVRSNLASNIPFTMKAQQRFYDSGKCSSSEQRIVVVITFRNNGAAISERNFPLRKRTSYYSIFETACNNNSLTGVCCRKKYSSREKL